MGDNSLSRFGTGPRNGWRAVGLAKNLPSPDTLIAALESLRELNLGGFFVDFSASKHMGSRYVDLTILGADGKVRR